MTVRNEHEFAGMLRSYRRLAGLTQEELAERAGISVRSVSDLERGLTRAPYPNTVRRLAEALDLGGEERTAFSVAALSESERPAVEEPGDSPPAPVAQTHQVPRAVSHPARLALVALLLVAGVGAFVVVRIFSPTPTGHLAWTTLADTSWGNGVFGVGTLERPVAVAVGSDGNVFVADAGADRIFSFTASGHPLRSWGGRGSGPGQLRGPQALATDSAGYVYVTDTGNNRVEKFSPVGTFLSAWSFPRRDWRALAGPDGIAVDAQGYVYVSDPGHRRVELWSSNGHLAGIFSESYPPHQLALDAGGLAYLASGSQVLTDDFANRTSRSLPVQPAAFPKTASPSGVAIDPRGPIYVADRSGTEIEQFAAPGRFIRAWSARERDGRGISTIAGIAIGQAGDIYVTDPAGGHIARFSSRGKLLGRWGPHLSFSVGDPEGVAVDRAGNVYITDALSDRLVELSASGQFIALRGGSGAGRGQFREPLGVNVDRSGNIYVADSGNNRVERLTPYGQVGEILGGPSPPGTLYDAPGQLRSPSDMAVDDRGRVYVADTFNKRVQVFDARGSWLATWSHFGPLSQSATGLPSAIAIGSGGEVYVADPWVGRLSVLSTSGEVLRYWKIGRAKGLGTGLAVTRDGKVVLADASTGRVAIYSRAGSLLGMLSDGSDHPLRFKDPTAVAVDARGDVYVADAGRSRVFKYLLAGRRG